MTPNSTVTVGDVEELDDGWSFTVDDCSRNARMCFVFKGRKEANVSRRLMKEILARSTAMSITDYAADSCELQLPVSRMDSPIANTGNAE